MTEESSNIPEGTGPTGASNSTPDPKDLQKEITRNDLIPPFFSGYGKDATEEKKKIFHELLKNHLNQIVLKYHLDTVYNILILFDDSTMVKSDADKIYSAVTTFTNEKPILLILLSRGGISGPAYLIGKLCQEHSKGEFVVIVPRHAKSAATLICCAAKEIHMGSLSELGPVDPQINNMPALGLKNSIEHIAGLVKKYPDSSEMFAKYLNLSIEPIQIGYYERVAESAMQYAENLLITHPEKYNRPIKEIAYDLVYKYKDHGFVIEKSEAEKIFGDKVIKNNTPEYQFGNEIYSSLNLVENMADFINYGFYLIGSLSSEPTLNKRKE
jgi:hypothetical protein